MAMLIIFELGNLFNKNS